MPRSIFNLFVSKYPDHNGLEIGDEVVVRLKAFNREPRKFKLVEIEPTVEDGETVYIYKGAYIGRP